MNTISKSPLRAVRTALLTASLLVPAAAFARPMTAEDVAKLEAVGAVAVSPDGSRVAYTTASLPDVTKGEKDGTTTQELKMAYGPDNARAFLPDDISPSGVTFSPDGRMVSFIWAKDDEDRAVWGIPVDGGAQRKLAQVEGADVRSHAWSPDSGTIYMLVGAAEDEVREDETRRRFRGDRLRRRSSSSIACSAPQRAAKSTPIRSRLPSPAMSARYGSRPTTRPPSSTARLPR